MTKRPCSAEEIDKILDEYGSGSEIDDSDNDPDFDTSDLDESKSDTTESDNDSPVPLAKRQRPRPSKPQAPPSSTAPASSTLREQPILESNDSTDSDDFNVLLAPQRRRTAPSSSTPQAPSTSTPQAPSTSTPQAPSTSTPQAPSTSREPNSSTLRERAENLIWGEPAGNQKEFQFTGTPGMNENTSGILANAKPLEYFSLFITPDIWNDIVDQTNLYATQFLMNANVSGGSRVHNWEPTNVSEMKSFFGIIGWMGLVKVQKLSDYWSTNDLFNFSLPRQTMSRNRFEILLQFLHFANNEQIDPTNRLCKVDDILKKIVHNFQESYTPGKSMCVDETMIPWRGRLVFRQYIPSKRHKYGIKLYKLCCNQAYTWNLTVYVGKDNVATSNVDNAAAASEKVVYNLTEDLVNEGRTLYVDNFYTSIPLALEMLSKETHVVGTLRKNRKYLPEEVKGAVLPRGDIKAMESEEGITVLKWKDKRDVLMLSTCHSGLDRTTVTTKFGRDNEKPACVVDYDKGKMSVDVSDQLSSYNTAVRKTTKWYRKLMIEIIWGTSLVNTHVLYNLNTIGTKLSITDFRKQVVLDLLKEAKDTEDTIESNRRRGTHHLIPHHRNKYGRCVECYKKFGKKGTKIGDKLVRPTQTKQVCDSCTGNPYFCLPCFNKYH